MLFVKKKHPPVDTHAAQGTGEVERQRRGPYRGALFNISPSSCSCCRRAASLSNSWVPTSPVPLGIVTKLPQRLPMRSGRLRPFAYPNGAYRHHPIEALEPPPLPASADARFSCCFPSHPSTGLYNPLMCPDLVK